MLWRQIANPIYLCRRFRLAIWEQSHPGYPWLAAEAIAIMERYLEPHHTALEFGSGRSTTWIGKRVGRLVSVESDAVWYERVKQQIDAASLENVDLRFHKIEHDDANLWHKTYNPVPSYVAVGAEFEDMSIDLCLIDGQYREACIAIVASKIKPGGLLVLDNMNWHPMSHWDVPRDYRLISAGSNVKTQTGVFVRTCPKSVSL